MELAAVTRPLVLTPEEFQDYAVTPPKHTGVIFGPVDPADLHIVNVVDLWAEDRLSKDWIVAYRLALQENNTRVVVAEIRIFPSTSNRIRKRKLEPDDTRPGYPKATVLTRDGVPVDAVTGRWIGEVLGYQAPVPNGGIKAESVLRRVRLRGFETELAALLKEKHAPYKVDAIERERIALDTHRRRGPKVDELRLARVAKIYSDAYTQGDVTPTRAVARALDESYSSAASAVGRARKRGFLPKASRGSRGGFATQKALAVLNNSTTSKARKQKA